MTTGIERFLEPQARDFDQALTELKSGRKRSHWMWYIFPQLKGLGHSEMASFYGITDLAEAQAFLQHPILGSNLAQICRVILQSELNDAKRIFGSPDDIKLRSSMTLFSAVPNAPVIFENVLKKFFDGKRDEQTLALLS